MGKDYKRRPNRGAYGEETLRRALGALKGGQSYHSVAKSFGVPRRTLQRHFKGLVEPLYTLIALLHQDVSLLLLQLQLAADGVVLHHHSRRYATLNDRLQQLWTNYTNGDLTTSRFLRARLQIACHV